MDLCSVKVLQLFLVHPKYHPEKFWSCHTLVVPEHVPFVLMKRSFQKWLFILLKILHIDAITFCFLLIFEYVHRFLSTKNSHLQSKKHGNYHRVLHHESNQLLCINYSSKPVDKFEKHHPTELHSNNQCFDVHTSSNPAFMHMHHNI